MHMPCHSEQILHVTERSLKAVLAQILKLGHRDLLLAILNCLNNNGAACCLMRCLHGAHAPALSHCTHCCRTRVVSLPQAHCPALVPCGPSPRRASAGCIPSLVAVSRPLHIPWDFPGMVAPVRGWRALCRRRRVSLPARARPKLIVRWDSHTLVPLPMPVPLSPPNVAVGDRSHPDDLDLGEERARLDLLDVDIFE